MDEIFMLEAYEEARKAYSIDEVPVGAVIVQNGKIIARGFNKKETSQNPLAHGEMEVILKSAKLLNRWRLSDCTLYVTLEPCSMCAGAIINARLGRVVIGAMDEKRGACGSQLNILNHQLSNYYPEVKTGILELKCSELLSDFFKNLRDKKKK